MLDSTVLLVNSDNGGDTDYTKGHPGNNYPLRSEKFAYYEGGTRVPAFVYAPGILPVTP
jgi:arylsulfatase A-like enzyme